MELIKLIAESGTLLIRVILIAKVVFWYVVHDKEPKPIELALLIMTC